jgi:hypothetical protein
MLCVMKAVQEACYTKAIYIYFHGSRAELFKAKGSMALRHRMNLGCAAICRADAAILQIHLAAVTELDR